MASLGRVILSNSAFQKKTSSPFDWFGHLLDSIHPITSLAAALVWSKVDPVMKHANNVLPSLKLTATSPRSMVGWMKFPQAKKMPIWTGADLLLASGMVISSRCCQNVWLPILHASIREMEGASFTPVLKHSFTRTFKIGKSIGLMKKKPGKIDRSREMRWDGTGQASTLGSRKKKHPQKKSCRNWIDPTFYYVLKSYQKEHISAHPVVATRIRQLRQSSTY